MKKLMMMAAVATAMVTTASAAEVKSMWLDQETGMLCITSSPDLGSILGYDDELYEISLGTTNRYGSYHETTFNNFPVMSHTSSYDLPTASYYHGPKSWDEALSLAEHTHGRVLICHKGDHGVDSETTIRVSQLARLYRTADGWKFVGEDGTVGFIESEKPVVEENDPEDEEDEEDAALSKCPVISFFQRFFKRR